MSDTAINPVTRRVQFTGNTGTGPFAFTFNILTDGDIAVYKNTTALTLTADYSVTINVNGTGSVTLVAALVSTDVLTIIGGRQLARTTDFVTAGDLLASSLNEQLDSNVIMAQQLDEKLGRGLYVNPGDVYTDLELPLKDARKGTVLGFNATTGNPEPGPEIGDVDSLAAISGDIKTLAEIQDGTVATDAITNVNTIRANVTTVAGISGNVTTVAGNTTNINTVAADGTDIGLVAGSIANVNTNATNIASINTNAANITAIQGAAGNAATATTKAAEAETAKDDAETARDAAIAAKNAAEAVDVITNATATASTLSAGSSATASVTATSGTGAFSFGIPTGAQGTQGTQGIQGVAGTNGTDGTGWTSGSYNASNGVVTFASDDGLGFVTGDLRGGADLYAESYDGTSTKPSATGTNSVGLGRQAIASGSNSLAFGYGAQATDYDSIAIGGFAYSETVGGVAIGQGAKATGTGTDNIALGDAYSNGNHSVAIGISNNTVSYGAIAAYAFAQGYLNKASGTASVAMGGLSNIASGASGVAIGGYNNTASGSNSVAFGNSSVASHANSMAFGHTATTSQGLEIALGGATNIVKVNGAYTLPQADGTANQVLTTDGAGAVTFATAGTGSGDLLAANNLSDLANAATARTNLGLGTAATTAATAYATAAQGTTADAALPKAGGALTGAVTTNSTFDGRDVSADGLKLDGIAAGATNYTDANVDTHLNKSTATTGEVLSWSGTDYDWIAAGGGSALELYAENPSTPTAPSATGTNAVAMGSGSTASGANSTTLGAGSNASGTNAFAAGGDAYSVSYGATANFAVALGFGAKSSNQFSAVLGGQNNTASGIHSIIAGGTTNAASGTRSVVIGGGSHIASGSGSACLGGYDNAASGSNSSNIGGVSNIASSNYSATIGGYNTNANVSGKVVFGSDYVNWTVGPQSGITTLFAATTDATATEALSGTTRLVLPNNSVYGFTGTIIARENSAQTNDFAVWEVKGGAVRAASAATTALGSYNINKISESTGAAAWAIAISADTTNGAIAFTVTGEASHSIRWVATINTTEVTY